MGLFRGEHTADQVLDGTPVFTGTPVFDQSAAIALPDANVVIAGTLTVDGATVLASTSIASSGTFATGTGNVTLAGNTAVSGSKTFTVGTGATALGGTLAVTGTSAFTGAISAAGGAAIVGTAAADNATAGNLGQVISALKAVGAPVSVATTNTPVNVLTLSLTAGDWDVSGTVNFTAGSATTSGTAGFAAGIDLTSATIPTDGSEVNLVIPAVTTSSFLAGTAVPVKRVNVSTTTNVYLVANANFSAGTVGVYGSAYARRVR